MMGLIIALHVIICILLIGIILVQSGRGGGLVDTLSGVESMFGTKTNAFLTRTTSVLSSLFIITCLSLALLSARQSRSLMRDIKTQEQPANVTKGKETPGPQAQTQTQAQAQTQTKTSNQVSPQTQAAKEAPKTE